MALFYKKLERVVVIGGKPILQVWCCGLHSDGQWREPKASLLANDGSVSGSILIWNLKKFTFQKNE
jgi:hypothetical protein